MLKFVLQTQFLKILAIDQVKDWLLNNRYSNQMLMLILLQFCEMLYYSKNVWQLGQRTPNAPFVQKLVFTDFIYRLTGQFPVINFFTANYFCGI